MKTTTAIIAGALSLAVLLGVALAGGGSPAKKPGTKPPAPGPEPEPGPEPLPPAFDFAPGKNVGVWSLSEKPGSWCGAPVIQKCTADYGDRVLEVTGDGLVWGWTPPGDLRAAQKYGPRLIADIEMRSSTKAKPSAGWKGDELAAAAKLAPLVHGVTSHGFVAPSLREVLQVLAGHGVVAYPQVYDSDRSTKPRKFLRQCLDSYHNAGFLYVVPLLGASAGADYLREWIDECRIIGVPFSLWSLQRLAERKIKCADVEV